MWGRKCVEGNVWKGMLERGCSGECVKGNEEGNGRNGMRRGCCGIGMNGGELEERNEETVVWGRE